ncbi:MAG: thymidylate synthase [Candidatus Buchananbacteria bacterium]
MNPKPGRIPTLHVIGESIPQAYYRALEAVWNKGALMPTQYDRHDAAGNLLDPPGRDARVLIEVLDPFTQPRYAPISNCEIGTYIAEILGVKDHRVIPMYLLNKIIAEKDLTAEEETYVNHWPYTYHERLFNHPETDGNRVNQVELAIDLVAATPYTRRAMCTTAVPNLDPFLKEDVPCLREVQFRGVEDENGGLLLNVSTVWRSRDLFKAWGDNVIGLTFLFARVADAISAKIGRPVKLGSYADYSMSLHIYGQDFSHFNGDESKGLSGFFQAFPDEEAFIAKALTSEMASYMLVVDQLENLKTPKQIAQWEFEESSLTIINDLIDGIQSGRYVC